MPVSLTAVFLARMVIPRSRSRSLLSMMRSEVAWKAQLEDEQVVISSTRLYSADERQWAVHVLNAVCLSLVQER